MFNNSNVFYYKDLPKVDLAQQDCIVCAIDARHIAETDFKGVRQSIDVLKNQHAYNTTLALLFVSTGKSAKVFFEYIVNMVSKYPDVLFFSADKNGSGFDGIFLEDCNGFFMYGPIIWYIYKKFKYLVPNAKSFSDIKRRIKNTLLNAGFSKSLVDNFLNNCLSEKYIYASDTEKVLETLFPQYAESLK